MKPKIKVLILNNEEKSADFATFITHKGKISLWPNSATFYGSGKFLSFTDNDCTYRIDRDVIFKFSNNILLCS